MKKKVKFIKLKYLNNKFIYKMNMRYLALFLTLSVWSVGLNAQVSKVNYQLHFNSKLGVYECYLVIKEGNAFSIKERVQMNSQVSIVVPSKTKINVVQNFMPLEDNQSKRSATPSKWILTNSVENVLKNEDFISFIPSLSPTALYNDLREGDQVKLFSFSVNPLPKCGEGVRLYDNGIDPSSSSVNLRGGDFTNGFTIGGVKQKYDSALPIINDALPTGDFINHESSVMEGSHFQLSAGNWTNANSYKWTGPNKFVSYEMNPKIGKVGFKNNGKYTLTVTSKDGCSTSKYMNLVVESAQDLVADQTITNQNNANSKEVKTKVDHISTNVYPNPATSFINVSVEANQGAKVVASIHDVDGKVIMANALNQTISGNRIDKNIPLKLKGGVYTMLINVDGQEYNHKFIFIE